METTTDRPVRTFHFRTIVDGALAGPWEILGTSVTDAVRSLREGLYDGETIVGWDS